MKHFHTPLEKWTTKALEQELELYREFGREDVAEAKELSNNEKRVAEIARLRKEEGYVWRITEEDLKANPDFAKAKIEVGQIVVYTEEEVMADRERIEKEKTKEAENVAKDKKEANEGGDKKGEVEQVYLGKTVVRISNRVISGKVYKDVHVASGETFTLSMEEFDRDVIDRE